MDRRQTVRGELKHPELIEIIDDGSGVKTYGPDQIWYKKNRCQKSGCGPTAASLLLAYLAITRPSLQALYPARRMVRKDFAELMETMFTYVTPGIMGLNRLEPFVEGVLKYASERGVALEPHVLQVSGIEVGRRDPFAELAPFVLRGLELDCPIALLVLATGQESQLQNWHWITITQAEISEGKLLATASDEGIVRSFDLGLWYETTPLSGGLVYFTPAS
jgi:hypothetical protein